MRARLLATLVAAVAIGAPPALAQDPAPTATPVPTPVVTPTPTPTPEPPAERSKAVKRVYRDYRRDGVIDACDHKRRTLKRTLKDLAPEADIETPDLRPLLEAAIEQHDDGDCDDPEPTPTPTPTVTATPAPTATVAPTTVPDTGGDGFDFGGGGGGGGNGGGGNGGGGSTGPLGPDDVTPLEPEATPAPTVAPDEGVGPAATPGPVFRNDDDGVPAGVLVLAVALALLALLGALVALAERRGWTEGGLGAARRAWREAAFRAGGTWGDFSDWIRVGR